MNEVKLIGLLKAEQAKYAHDALFHPSDKTEFEYGYRAGVYSGYQRSIDAIEKLIADSDEDRVIL